MNDPGKPATTKSTGSLYRYVAPSANPVKATPEWNTVEVRCEGPRIGITFNGRKTLNIDQNSYEKLKDKPLRGYLAVQSHSGPVEFRNLWVRPLGKRPLPSSAGANKTQSK